MSEGAETEAEITARPEAADDVHDGAATVPLRRNRAFVLFWSGQTVSELGDQVTALALPLSAVVLLHASTFQVSALTAASWLPALLGAPAGTWIDRRRDKRTLMLAADLGRAAVLLSLPAAASLGHVTLVQLYLVALLTGSIALVFNTSYPALRIAALAASEFLVGAGAMLFDVNQNAILTAAVPDGLRSRVAGVYSGVNYGIRPVGSLLGGVVASHVGLRATLLTSAIGGSLALGCFLASPIPRIKTLDMIDGLRGAGPARPPGETVHARGGA